MTSDSHARVHRLAQRSERRSSIERFVRGQSSYIGDLDFPGIAEVAFARSPLAHAEILDIDTRAARAVPGVLAVLTAADLMAVGPQPRMWDLPNQRACSERALAEGRLRYVGEAYAVVVAVSRQVAVAAAALVSIRYNEMSPVLSIDRASLANAVTLYSDWPDNVVARSRWQAGDVAHAMKRAAIVVSETFTSQRVHPLSIETRGVIARPEPDGGLTLWTSTQAPHQVRAAIAESLGAGAPTAGNRT